MPWSLTWTSCAYTSQPCNIDGIIRQQPKAHWMLGDHSYFAWGYDIFLNQPTPDLKWDTPADAWVRKAHQFFYQPGWQKLLKYRDDNDAPLFWASCGDDHGLGSGNWDHTVAGASDTKNGIQYEGQTLDLSHVYHHWCQAREGHYAIEQMYFDNPQDIEPPNTYIPLGMAGQSFVSATKYPKSYWYTDFVEDGIIPEQAKAAHARPSYLVENGRTDLVVRVITIDTLSYKSPVKEDGSGITMLGDEQEAWLFEVLEDAMRAQVKMILIASCKELFNTNNADGWKGYIANRDSILARMEPYPVVWLSGDRHYPHVGYATAPYTVLSIGAAPFATPRADSLTPYAQELWRAPKFDTRVYGVVTVDEGEAQEVRFAIRDVDEKPTDNPLWERAVAFGSKALKPLQVPAP